MSRPTKSEQPLIVRTLKDSDLDDGYSPVTLELDPDEENQTPTLEAYLTSQSVFMIKALFTRLLQIGEPRDRVEQALIDAIEILNDSRPSVFQSELAYFESLRSKLQEIGFLTVARLLNQKIINVFSLETISAIRQTLTVDQDGSSIKDRRERVRKIAHSFFAGRSKKGFLDPSSFRDDPGVVLNIRRIISRHMMPIESIESFAAEVIVASNRMRGIQAPLEDDSFSVARPGIFYMEDIAQEKRVVSIPGPDGHFLSVPISNAVLAQVFETLVLPYGWWEVIDLKHLSLAGQHIVYLGRNELYPPRLLGSALIQNVPLEPEKDSTLLIRNPFFNSFPATGGRADFEAAVDNIASFNPDLLTALSRIDYSCVPEEPESIQEFVEGIRRACPHLKMSEIDRVTASGNTGSERLASYSKVLRGAFDHLSIQGQPFAFGVTYTDPIINIFHAREVLTGRKSHLPLGKIKGKPGEGEISAILVLNPNARDATDLVPFKDLKSFREMKFDDKLPDDEIRSKILKERSD